MAAPPPESSHTPPGTPLIESTPLHGDSMEDLDPQATRKRPRLDSGSRVVETLSLDGALATPAPASDMDLTPDPARPASKVTINMKSPASELASAQLDGPADHPDPAPKSQSAARDDSTPANVVSISSSPAQSPEIEVAELEDMDQDPNMSNWRPLEEALRDNTASEVVEVQDLVPLIDSFPKVCDGQAARESLEQICLMLEKGDANDAIALVAVKRWMDDCVRVLNRLTPAVFAEDRDFWELIPLIIESLLRRGHEIHPNHGQGLWTFLEEFFLNYARITIHLVRQDTLALNRWADETDLQVPECMSRRYLQPLSWSLQFHAIPFFRALDKLYDGEMPDLVLRLKILVAAPPIDLVDGIAEYAFQIISLTPKCQHLATVVPLIVCVSNSLTEYMLERRQSMEADLIVDSPAQSRNTQTLYEMMRSIDEKYQESVTKKFPWASSDMSEQMLRLISRGYSLFCNRDPDFIHQLSKDLSIELSEAATSEKNTSVILWAWKFGVLKKHIMDGRMELRVFGVETMQSDLVSIWQQTISNNPDGLAFPFVQYLVRFLRDNKIVDYLVGVDSHPQLISRSSNIVGFLVVTSAYNDLDTDTIWKTVTESQDSRTVSEVLIMLMRTFPMHSSGSPALLYVCTKLLELPLDRFDARMIEVCELLLPRMRERPVSGGVYGLLEENHVDPIPLRLCVRLIRESTAAEDLSVEHKTQLQRFGSAQLGQFIKAGLSEMDKMEMYERCIQDIAEMNQFTAGSIQALNALVPSSESQEIWKLATDFDLTRLVIQELRHTVGEGHIDFSDPFSRHGFISRVQIVYRLIDMAPDTITPELSSIMWNEVLMSKKLGNEVRKAVWDMMVNVTSRSGKHNSFLERCIREYLPGLLPQDFSHEVLLFAKQSINYEVRLNPPPMAGEEEVVSIPGIERIWTFILTAPPGTIETEATKFAIDLYLDHQIIRRSPRSAVEATHMAIVNRCVDQLKSAAAKLKSPNTASANGDIPMEIDSSNGDLEADELSFSRSLLFLRQLLHGLRTRPQYSPPQSSPSNLPDPPLSGQPIVISYQWFSGNSNSAVCSLRIGDLSTAADLVERLTLLTGFSKFTTIAGGQRIELLESPKTLLKDLKLHPGLLMIRKSPDAQEVDRSGKRQSFSSVDFEVLKHFDELYELLGLKDDLAREIFDFLLVFPPQDRALELVRSEEKNEKDLFPLQQPFIALYSLSTLSSCLREEAVELSPKQSVVSHSIQTLAAFLTANELFESLAESPIKFHLATHAVECLLVALPIYRPTDDGSIPIHDPQSLVQRLLSLIETGRHVPAASLPSPRIQKLICHSFAVLIEGSLCDHKFWNTVKRQAQFDQLILSLLLNEDRQQIRHSIAERIKITCSPSKLFKQSTKTSNEEAQALSPAESPGRIDMLATIWNSFVQVIPKTLQYARQSAEFFTVALWVFRSVAEKSPSDLILGDYLAEWSQVMLSHCTEEFVGREQVDYLILGFADLLEVCLDLADTAKITLDTFDLAEQILNNYLLPELSTESDDRIVTQIPVLHTWSRQKLYNIVNLLCKQRDENYEHVLVQLEDAIPRDYVSSWCVDRTKMLRAPEGYAGLKNLSNTCYLNSLMTQLFMNIEFREFILKMHLTDSDSSQMLLNQTQKLFAWMQETWRKSVDPQEFVDSILTYDNEAIDVTIQMDVDEFYNLLFDRWEAQITDPEEKKKFRLFYGGQLVQQIKSKECDHISERLEPFSAIQCEIKGKASLEESLQAYVEGEIMQGDNKYSCTSCGRHVDAVKRACLKDVPNNLIFHLKRFDFDMVTMMRSKINDEFQFPERIDMTPFKVDYLSESNASVAPDVFELVGVLVHTGTAESGHYYSYTRERSPTDASASWVEFNDSDVTHFDPSTIADHCFGGQGESIPSMGGAHLNKVWNAYMLFYQRVPTGEGSAMLQKPEKPNFPVRVPVPTTLANHISMENELLIRSYCLLDPYYAFFVQRLLRRLHETHPEYPNRLRIGRLAIDVGLDTLEQLVSRSKDYRGLDGIFTELFQILPMPDAALRVLEWVCTRHTSLQNLILKILNPDVRHKETMIIMGAVKRIHAGMNDSDIDESQRNVWREKFDKAIEQIVAMLEVIWPSVQVLPRAWDDYFDFFIRLAEFGPRVIEAMLDNEIFVKCLEIIWLDVEDRKRLRQYYVAYHRLREKGRRFSYRKMAALCLLFFKNIDLSLPPTAAEDGRTCSEGRFSLSVRESSLINPLEEDGSLLFLTKLLQHESISDSPACLGIFITFLEAEPQAGFLGPICRMLEGGLRISPAAHCAPFLDATLVFCKHCPDKERILCMIDFVGKGLDTIENSGGSEHLQFFTRLRQVSNDRLDIGPKEFTMIMTDKIPDWVPVLLIYPDRNVRLSAVEALRTLLFHGESDREEDRPRHATIARALLQACVERVKKSFLDDQIRTVESRLVEAISSVMTHCLEVYFNDSEEDQQILKEANAVLVFLERVTVDVPDDLASESDPPSAEEWDANSALASDSEMGLAGSP